MSWLPRRDGWERREQTGKERLDAYRDSAIDPKIYQPSDEGVERRMDEPRRPEMPPETRPRYSGHGQQNSPLGRPFVTCRYPADLAVEHRTPLSRPTPKSWNTGYEQRGIDQTSPPRNPSTDWQEERRLPPQRRSSPGWEEERRLPPQRRSSPVWQDVRDLPQLQNFSRGWREERPLADSDTLPARLRNYQPAKTETRDYDQGQPRDKGVKVHFSRPDDRRQITPEEDDDEEEEEESSSSSASSLGESIAVIRKPDNRNHPMSYSFGLLEHEGAGSGDEDGFVHVSRRLRRGTSRGSPHGRRG